MKNADDWAQEQFGQSNLGDPRRTKRLVKLASNLAQHPHESVVKSCSSPADMEGAYRFIRNENISAEEICQAGFKATANKVMSDTTYLALEDTTTLSYSHSTIRNSLGHINNGNLTRGLFAHSILLFSLDSNQVTGLIEQHRWTRNIAERGKSRDKHHVAQPYHAKECYKWLKASQNMVSRLGDKIENVISVCDREADIYECLCYKIDNNQYFAVRSMQSRCIEEDNNKLYQYAASLTVAGKRNVFIAQKGGRKARVAECEIKYAQVTLKVPSNKRGTSVPLYYVGCTETDNNEQLSWHLLTSEPIMCHEDALKIISYYEKRWLIEEYHKVWKSHGTGVEEVRVQCKDNLERLLSIYAFLAVRLLQLKFANEQPEDISCEEILSTKVWKLLWLKQLKTKPPKEVPTAKWAYQQLARLGGWKDSKRNGKDGSDYKPSLKVMNWLNPLNQTYEQETDMQHRLHFG